MKKDIGIFASGSWKEDHGAALPKDADIRIAKKIAEETAARTGSDFLGTLESSHELPEIDTGDHQPIEEMVEELKLLVERAKSEGYEGVLLVNGHGGNQELENYLDEIEEETGVSLRMDSTVCRLEGPHSGTGELSVGSIIGITEESKLEEHIDPEENPEVGFCGFEEVQEKYEWAEEHAKEILEKGVEVDEKLGRILLESAIASACNRVLDLRAER